MSDRVHWLLICISHLNNLSTNYSYTPSQADLTTFEAVGAEPTAHTNAARWYRHIASYVAEKFTYD